VILLHELPGMSLQTADLGGGWPTLALRPTYRSSTASQANPAPLRCDPALLCAARIHSACFGPVQSGSRLGAGTLPPSPRLYGGSGVGVVGMCFTGGLALAATIEPKVRAAVSSQPALPLNFPPTKRRRANLGLSPMDLKAAAESGTPVMAIRFRHDPVSP
jgi:hypothetical protein